MGMTFSDNDLKRLCYAIEDKEARFDCDIPSWDKLAALVARLEAAERVCKILLKNGAGSYILATHDLEIWRKAAGK